VQAPVGPDAGLGDVDVHAMNHDHIVSLGEFQAQPQTHRIRCHIIRHAGAVARRCRAPQDGTIIMHDEPPGRVQIFDQAHLAEERAVIGGLVAQLYHVDSLSRRHRQAHHELFEIAGCAALHGEGRG
jgi:hypothetical protein